MFLKYRTLSSTVYYNLFHACAEMAARPCLTESQVSNYGERVQSQGRHMGCVVDKVVLEANRPN